MDNQEMRFDTTVAEVVRQRRRWDVAVVGAGPAGCVAALLLARAGKRVVLIERSAFPREKTCGCCVGARGVRMLRELGLGNVVERGAELTAVEVRRGGRRLRLAIPGGRAVLRAELDAGLARAAVEAGAVFVSGCAARLMGVSDEGRGLKMDRAGREGDPTTEAQRHGEIRAGLVLACDGIRGGLLDGEPGCAWRVARNAWMGAAVTVEGGAMQGGGVLGDCPHGVICMHVARRGGGYVGAVRLRDGRVHLAAAVDPRLVQAAGGLAAALRGILQEAGARGAWGELEGKMNGAPLLTRARSRCGAERVLAVGDACGYVEPFTGEGITWALASAVQVSAWVAGFGETLPRDLALRWTRVRRQALRREQALCRGMRWLLHRPRLAGLALAMARAWPAVGQGMIRVVDRPGMGALT